jgi:hypothetical protein
MFLDGWNLQSFGREFFPLVSSKTPRIDFSLFPQPPRKASRNQRGLPPQ